MCIGDFKAAYTRQTVIWTKRGRGSFIKTDLTTSEKLTVKFHNTKLSKNEEPLETGGYIFDKQSFEALYDDGDGRLS